MSASSTTFEFAQKQWDLARFEALIRQALSLDLDYSSRARTKMFTTQANPQIRKAHVLLLIGIGAKGPEILMTKRTQTVETHKGQMALPGGMTDEGDHGKPESYTALRETEEEVGVPISNIQVVGGMPTLPTYSSGFSVTPWVGLLKAPTVLVNNADEIEMSFWIPIESLEGVYTQEWFQPPGTDVRYPTHVYYVDGHRIWGATGAILKNFLDRLQQVKA